MQLLGHCQRAAIAPGGEVISPAGPPTDMVFRAQSTGHATLEIVTGDPWHGTETIVLNVIVKEQC